jgi:putative peptidoglycan binding protein
MTLRLGDRGDNVRKLQRALQGAGFSIGVTGVYDAATYATVKSFQEAHHLGADGLAGRQTFQALSLDPETLEDLGPPLDADRTIDAFVDTLNSYHLGFINSSGLALDDFANFIGSASTRDARPDVWNKVLGKLLGNALDDILGGIAKHDPIGASLKYLKDAFEAYTAEEERAAAAARMVTVRDWMSAQRGLIASRSWLDPVALKDRLRRALTEAADEAATLRAMHAQTAAISEQIRLAQDKRVYQNLRLGLFEGWINAHFRGIDKGAGYVEVVHGMKKPWGEFDEVAEVSARVWAPFADRVQDALNSLLDDNNRRAPTAKFRAGLNGAFALRVHKRLVVTEQDKARFLLVDTPLPIMEDALATLRRDNGAWFDPAGNQLSQPSAAQAKPVLERRGKMSLSLPIAFV